MDFLRIAAEKPSLQPETIFYINSWPITNAILMSWLVIFLVILICIKIRSFQLSPRGAFQHIVEMTYEGILNLLDQITGNRKYSARLLYLIGALFIYIGFSNIIGLIPLLTSLTFGGVSILRTPTNDFNLTFSLALSMIILTQVVSIKDYGIFGHLGKYIKIKEVVGGFKKSIAEGFTGCIEAFVGILDIIAEVAKVISLSLRLFGNMYAGEVLAIIILGAFAYGLPSVWLAMNLLVAVVQTIVFGSLTAAYYMMSVKMEDEQGAEA